MCGIAGWMGQIDESSASEMMLSLMHRGPDNQSFKYFDNACLIHTRLSIIDLSSSGNQPISDKNKIVWVVFNGEIYNHKELKQEFINQGISFDGHSDSEVLPYLYLKYGDSFVSKLNGMFSLAIYDTRDNKLILIRDEFGVKPLFYSKTKQGLVFSSEINALKKIPCVNLDINEQSIYDFTALSYIPGPSTFYKNIMSLEPGSILEAKLDIGVNFKIKKFKTWSIRPNKTISFDDFSDQTEKLLENSVLSQLETDVPIGVLLSGGIDSSLVSAFAQKNTKNKINTYNVQFSDSLYDESWAAKSVANHIHSNHKVLAMDSKTGTWDYIIDTLLHCGQPFADTSMFAMNSISKLMAKEGCKVVLSGDGGDEGFGGYSYYSQLPKIMNYKKLPRFVWTSVDYALNLMYKKKFINSTFAGSFHDFVGSNSSSMIRNLFSHIRENEQQMLFNNNNFLTTNRHFDKQWEYSESNSLSSNQMIISQTTEANLRLSLPNDFLFKVDMASMKESIEVRVPMLDKRIVDYSLNIPYNFKASKKQTKLILRNLAKKNLPKEVAMKAKMGFGVPVDDWIDNDCRNMIFETLTRKSSTLPEILDKNIYKHWLEAFKNKTQIRGLSRGGLYYRVIMLLALDLHL